jgi:hypothetical protein
VDTNSNLHTSANSLLLALATVDRAGHAKIRRRYRLRSAWYFGCRTCQNLTYRSVQEHDKRVDRLVKHFYAIPAALESKDHSKVLLALKACGKIYGWY